MGIVDPRTGKEWDWRRPTGGWSVTICGKAAAEWEPLAAMDPRPVGFRVKTLCGGEECVAEGFPKEAVPAVVFARMAQVCASIQHVVRFACHDCHRAFSDSLTPTEARYLWYTRPALGPALGFDGSGAQTVRDVVRKTGEARPGRPL